MGARSVRRGLAAGAGAACLLALASCNASQAPSQSEETKRSLDQLVQATRESAAAAKDGAAQTKSLLEEVRKLSGRLEEIEKTIKAAAADRKRGALYLPIETETVCDNDTTCSNTARAICNRVGYPNAVAARYTPGTRPTLNTAVCFD